MLIIIIILSVLFTKFILSNHPLIIGFILMLSRIVYGFTIYIINSTPWLTYILIIIFVRGMIVIFIYIAGLSSNEPITFKIESSLKILLFSWLTLATFFISIKQLKISNTSLNTINQFFKEQAMETVYKTYNKIIFETTIILTIYLLIVLIVRIKIINNFKMPLRASK